MPHDTATKAALGVMDAHIEALNAREPEAIARTLHFPHYRLSGTGMKIWETPESYFEDFRARAGGNWGRSEFADIRVLQAADSKVHLDAEIRRFDAEGALYQSFRSLWVITHERGHWAARLRSSFAPQ